MSNPVFDAAFAAERATIVREAPVPTGPLGYGSDLSCTTDCTPDYAEVDPLSKRALGEALFRRLTTRRGSVLDDANLGTDTRQYLHRGVTARDMQTYRDEIVGECSKDDRVESSDCTMQYIVATRNLRFALTVHAVDSSIGVFTLTFAVAEDGAALIESIV